MWALLRKINQNLVIAIPSAMLLGLGFGLLFPAIKLSFLIVPLTFIMVYPMMTTLRLKNLLKWNDTKTQVLTQFLNFAVIPFIAFGLGKFFFADKPFYALGLLLAALLPTSGMTISWTGFAKGNIEAAVKMTVLGLSLGSLATPFYLQLLMGKTIPFEILPIIRQIFIIVFIPMTLGHFTRQYLVKKTSEKHFKEQYAPKFSSFSTLGVLGIVFIAISLKAKSLVVSPMEIIYIAIPVVLLYLINFILSTVVGKKLLPRGDAIALVYGTVMRNLSISLALALNVFGEAGPEIALVITLAFIFQVQSAAWYVRYTPKFFGQPPQ